MSTEDSHERATALDPAAVEALNELVGGDPETIREIADAFLQDAPERMAEIRDGLADDDDEIVRRAAHTLKANGLTFGALAFADACRELEETARAGKLDAAVPIAAKIERSWAATRPAIEAMA